MASATRSISCLFRFMLVFGIDRFEIIDVSATTIKARVGWPDDGVPDYDAEEEVQDIEWEIQALEPTDDALTLAEYLIDEGLMCSDRIMIGRDQLSARIGWSPLKFDAAIQSLLNMKVDMQDDGRKTDFYFVHF
ncbi:MAG: hypothetical protein JJ900_16860 [Rhodospirillales bacterium]|nr:hypothetical protein [Rhodospirillales bacterium]MBO6788520.1 hypothetical protein [Rhodospirillales bacterium]